MESSTRTCPSCGRSIEFNRGYSTWCECGWNLGPPLGWEDNRQLMRTYRRGRRLFDQLGSKSAVATLAGQSAPRLVAAAIGLVTFALVAALLVIGILFVLNDDTAIRIVGVLVVIAALYLCTPLVRTGVRSTVSRRQLPNLFSQLDEVCKVGHVARISDLTLTRSDMSIRVVQAFANPRRVLVFGLPRVWMSTPDVLTAAVLRECYIERAERLSGVPLARAARDILQLLYGAWTMHLRLSDANDPYEKSLNKARDMASYRVGINGIAQRSRRRLIEWIALPIWIWPFVGMVALNYLLLPLEQLAVYAANRHLADTIGRKQVEKLLQSIALIYPVELALDKLHPAASALERQRAVLDAVTGLPDREQQRLLRVAPDATPERPLIAWQIALLNQAVLKQQVNAAPRINWEMLQSAAGGLWDTV